MAAVASEKIHPENTNNNSSRNMNHEDDIETLRLQNESLSKALEFEEVESQQLQRQIHEQRAKLDTAVHEKSKLEQDISDKDQTILKLQQELQKFKRSKQDLENQLSQEQMHYINEKQQWLDKEAEYEKKLAEQQPQSKDNNNRLKNELDVVKQQLELVSKEYSLRHEALKDESDELRKFNEGLMEENQGYQYLLVQRTIQGELLSDQEEEEETTLKHQNQALKQSLERLVKRLLEFKDFEKEVLNNSSDEAQITPRSISLFHKRVGPHKTTLDVPMRKSSNNSDAASFPSSPTSTHSSTYQHYKPSARPLKPSSTWSSLIFSPNSASTLTITNNNNTQSSSNSTTPYSPASSIETSTKSSASSSIESVTTGSDDDPDIKNIINEHNSNLRRPSTNGQKRLRPLKLISLEDNNNNSESNSSATTGHSWSFNIY